MQKQKKLISMLFNTEQKIESGRLSVHKQQPETERDIYYRLSDHGLVIETGGRTKHDNPVKTDFCRQEAETEQHFLLHCNL